MVNRITQGCGEDLSEESTHHLFLCICGIPVNKGINGRLKGYEVLGMISNLFPGLPALVSRIYTLEYPQGQKGIMTKPMNLQLFIIP